MSEWRDLADRVAASLERTSATARSLSCASPAAALAACGEDEALLNQLNDDLARLEFHVYQKQPGYRNGTEAISFAHLFPLGRGAWTGRSTFGHTAVAVCSTTPLDTRCFFFSFFSLSHSTHSSHMSEPILPISHLELPFFVSSTTRLDTRTTTPG